MEGMGGTGGGGVPSGLDAAAKAERRDREVTVRSSSLSARAKSSSSEEEEESQRVLFPEGEATLGECSNSSSQFSSSGTAGRTLTRRERGEAPDALG